MNKALLSVLISRVERRLAAELFGLERPRSCVICVLLKKSERPNGSQMFPKKNIIDDDTIDNVSPEVAYGLKREQIINLLCMSIATTGGIDTQYMLRLKKWWIKTEEFYLQIKSEEE